jgi:hypothetical protein
MGSQALKRLHGTEAVHGASGWLSFASTGGPINKAVPIVALQPRWNQPVRARSPVPPKRNELLKHQSIDNCHLHLDRRSCLMPPGPQRGARRLRHERATTL